MPGAVDETLRALAATQPIFHRATAAGTGGIATLILDGADARALLKNIFQSSRDITAAESGALIFGRILDASGRVIDEALAAPVGKDESETGNEQIELSCHGGLGAVASVEQVLLAAGFVRARPTELLERGHLNGKLSLLEIEAQLALARATTERQVQLLLDHDKFQRRVERWGFEAGLAMRQGGTHWRADLMALAKEELERAERMTRVLKLHRVVLLGAVNAGKSSLANWLAGAERHLVSPIAGTTVDRIETPLTLRGLSLLLTDTAGLRETNNSVEQEGQRRARAAAESADLRLLLLDGSREPSDADTEWVATEMKRVGTLLVLTKSDLGVHESARGLGFLAGRELVEISVRTGAGLEALSAAIESELLPVEPDVCGPFTTRQVQRVKDICEVCEGDVEAIQALEPLRKLIGTRPDPLELGRVFG